METESAVNPYALPGLASRKAEVRRARITKQSICEACANAYGITPEDMMRRTRRREVCEPRQVAMHLMRFALGMGVISIGVFFRLDHATVLHATHVVRKLMIYSDFKNRYDKICAEIGFE